MEFFKSHKKFVIFFAIFIFLFISINLEGDMVENIKLKLTRYWGLTTLENNPLLKSADSDLKQIDQTNSRIDLNELLSGGPGKDGIPSIDNPQFEPVSTSQSPDERLIIGVFHDGIAKAYPYSILNWHEIVNDRIGDLPISVTLCPLCDTNPVFVRIIDGKETTFGVSGKLYQSCLIMYDRATDSLWSQPTGVAVAGERVNEQLKMIPSVKTTVGEWKKLHPDSLILTTDTGYDRDYTRYPYGTYYTDDNIIFPTRNSNNLKDHPKEIYSYIYNDSKQEFNAFSGEYLSYSHKEVRSAGRIEITNNPLADEALWDTNTNSITFKKAGAVVPASTAFYFILPAFFGS